MTDLDLDAIKARCEVAAPGPWEVYNPNGPDHGALWSVANDAYHNPTESNEDDAFGLQLDCGGIEDAEFIAQAREAVPALIVEVERLRAEARRMQATLYPESVVLHNAAVHHALRREVNRIAAHAAAEDRTLRWVADELVDALATNPYPDGSPADEIERLTAELAEEKRQRGITAQVSWRWKERVDELTRQLHLPASGAVLPFPPITITEA
jgi:hypothetical protein